jgi:hypothetical protein
MLRGLVDNRIPLKDTPEHSSSGLQTIKIVHKTQFLYTKQLHVPADNCTQNKWKTKQVNPYVYNQVEIKKF